MVVTYKAVNIFKISPKISDCFEMLLVYVLLGLCVRAWMDPKHGPYRQHSGLVMNQD